MKTGHTALAREPDPGADKPEALVYRESWCAEAYEEDRYGGAFGQFLKAQEVELFCGLLGEGAGSVLDAGAGTGKLTLGLMERGWRVTSSDFSLEMLRIARSRAAPRRLRTRYCVSDLQALSFRDGVFDCAVSSRVLMHLANWRQGLAELCRVTRRTIVLDVPARYSFAGMESFVRRKLGLKSPSDAPSYEAFTLRAVATELERNGFGVTAVRRTFSLPVSLHRRLNRPVVTRKIETLLERAGITRLIGNPLTLRAERRRAL